MSHYLVTGGAGFIGSHLTEALISRGHTVTVIDNLSSGDLKNLNAARNNNLHFIEGDIRDISLVEKTLKECDGVFHLAALVSVPASLKDPLLSFTVNLQGTLNIFEASRKLGNKKIIFASSAAVYGNTNKPVSENSNKSPLSPYGLHKWMGEEHALIYSQQYCVRSAGMRFFNVYGPRQNPSSPYSGVISIFNDKIKKEQPAIIYGDGTQIRDFVYVTDVVEAMYCAMRNETHNFEIYNIGTGEGTRIIDLWKTMCEIIETDIKPIFQPARCADIKVSIGQVTKIHNILNFKTAIRLRDGLIKLINNDENQLK